MLRNKKQTKKRINKLIYTLKKQDQRTIKRHFLIYRNRQTPPVPFRCDNTSCLFHTQSLLWNGKQLDLILDHINGVNSDNRPSNLRFLCPNCNSQLNTNAGKNKGKVKKSSGGFSIKNNLNKYDYHLPVETLYLTIRS